MNLLSTCAVCGGPVATKACARCKTLYCSTHCQQEHWNSGHKKMCKKIQRAGGAEQFHADAKAKEAADAAVAACGSQGVPQDAECFICRSSIEGKGIVRGCGCHSGAGLAHVACLVRAAQVSVQTTDEDGVGVGWTKWQKCVDCNQRFHGAVKLALGWAAWKAFRGLQDADDRFGGVGSTYDRCQALGLLGNALRSEVSAREALPVLELALSTRKRFFSYDLHSVMVETGNVAQCHADLGHHEKALSMRRELYAGRVALSGESHPESVCAGLGICSALILLQRFSEGKELLRGQLRLAQPDTEAALLIEVQLAAALHQDPAATRDDRLEAAAIARKTLSRLRRCCGPEHPRTRILEKLQGSIDSSLASRPGP